MQYDNRNKGALWKIKDNYKVIMNGNINMEGHDRRVIAVSRKNAQGEPTISLYEEIGNLKKHESENDRAPSAKGVLDIRKLENTKSVGAWKKNKKDGEEFWSISLSDYETKGQNNDNDIVMDNDNTHLSEIEDDIPF